MRELRQPYRAHCERIARADDKFLARLPRSIEGEGLAIAGRQGDGVVITDGERSALYVPCKGGQLPGRLRIEKGYTEPGWFMEAAIVLIGNGKSSTLYEPLKIVDRPEALPGARKVTGRRGR